VTILVAVGGSLAAYGLTTLLTKGIKVSPQAEDLGLDCTEHGEPAYPAFNGMD
jgi:Amt family ammonium transporter